MIKERFLIYVFLVFIIFPLFASAQTRDYLAEGNRLLEQDQEAILGALNLWVTGYEKKKERGETDLELSFKIVKTIASKQLKKLYSKAHNIYFQSIKDANLNGNSTFFRNEVERLLPLLSKSEVSEWSQYLKSDPFLLKNEIINFGEILIPF